MTTLAFTCWGLLQVCDFNLSRVVEETVGAMTSLSATNPKWLAPEVLSGRPCTTASDVYAFGIILCAPAHPAVPLLMLQLEGLSQSEGSMALQASSAVGALL